MQRVACAGETTVVVPLPPLPALPATPKPRSAKGRFWSLCSVNSTAVATCDWRGPPIDGPLHMTHMHSLESAVFNRFVECSSATTQSLRSRRPLHLIPFPATDIMINLQGAGGVPDALLQDYYEQVKKSLSRRHAWRRCGGCDHVLVLSRSAGDYPQRCPWGCGLVDRHVFRPPRPSPPGSPAAGYQFRLDDPFWANVSILTQEQIPPAHLALPNVFPMARPSCVHPRSRNELKAWQRALHVAPRDRLFTLAAAVKNHRVHLFDACKADPNCHFVDCAKGPAMHLRNGRSNGCHPQNLYSAYSRSVYCLMPQGDTPSRRAIFDALACGCIPIVYHRFSFHWPWHVPNRSLAALLIPTPAQWAKPPPTGVLARLRGRFAPTPLESEQATAEAQPLWMGDPADIAHEGHMQTHASSYNRTLALVRSRSVEESSAQRRWIIDHLLPRIIYHYGDPEADDAVTLALRRIRERVDAHEAALYARRRHGRSGQPSATDAKADEMVERSLSVGALRAAELASTTMRMTPSEAQRWLSLLLSATTYLEWGTGGSSVVAAWLALQPEKQPPLRLALAVDSSAVWLETLRSRYPILVRAEATGQLATHVAGVGATGAWGVPTNWTARPPAARVAQARGYVEAGGRYGVRLDLILIDGRWRKACALHALRLAHPQTIVLIHDSFVYVLQASNARRTHR